MGRLPTETDLLRLCDAADSITKYYQQFVLQNRGIVNNVSHELDSFATIVGLLPYPRHYWTPFEIDFWEARERWNGWNDEVYDAFVGVIFPVRNIHLHWLRTGGDKANLLADVRLHISTRGFIEEQIENLKHHTDLLRTLCQFIPCEQQIDILSALEGKSLTAEQLMKLCNIPKSRLYGKRDDKTVGGLNELMRLDLIRNGSKDDSGIKGYYRPDRPPE